MPELRWILLIAGLVFLGVLALWESRRQRRLPPPAEDPTQHRFREPELGLPHIRPREAAPELPIVQIDDDELDGLHSDEPALAAEPPVVEPVVDWPPERERRLVALRLVAAPDARFTGRALRLALTAEGFQHGKFDIFHKPGADARVIVSAASMTQPGSFDLQAMDTQRFGGLGLFAVLPGPLSDGEAVDALLEVAMSLSERLQGVLQDERGRPLDEERIAALRASVLDGGGQAGAATEAPEASS